MVQCRSDEIFNNSKVQSITKNRDGWYKEEASAEVVAQLQAAAAANDEGSVKSIAASAAAAAQAAAAQAPQTQDPNAAGQTQAPRHRRQVRMRQARHRTQTRMQQAGTGTQTQQPAAQTQ